MTDERSVKPGETRALVVAVESYPYRLGLDLDGPYPDACGFVRWLRACQVPPDNIVLIAAPLEKNKDLGAQLEQEGVKCRRTELVTQESVEVVLPRFRRKPGMLVLFWSGHGIMTTDGVRRPLLGNYSDADKHTLNVESLLRHLRSGAPYNYPPVQILIFDICGTRFDELSHRQALPDKTFPTAPQAADRKQYVMLASEDGFAAENITQRRTGLYYSELRTVLESQASWPPNLDDIHESLKARFKEMRSAGTTVQSPIRYIWQAPLGGREEFDLTLQRIPPAGTRGESRNSASDHVVVQHLALAETRYALSRLRFRPAATNGVVYEDDVSAAAKAIESITVPPSVLTRLTPSLTTDDAFRAERQRFSPPRAEERLTDADRKHIITFNKAIDRWYAGQKPLVLLGDPGYGKSWLSALLTLRYLDQLVRLGDSHGPGVDSPSHDAIAAGTDCPPLPLHATCQELGRLLGASENVRPEVALSRLMVSRIQSWHQIDHSCLNSYVRCIRKLISSRSTILILDGWDERDPANEDQLVRLLRTWCKKSGPRRRLLITSRTVGYTRNLLFEAFEWQIMPLDTPGGVEQLVHTWFTETPSLAKDLWTAIETRPQLMHLLRIPLIGALFCWRYQQGEFPTFPVNRSQILNHTLSTLIRDACRSPSGTIAIERDPGSDLHNELRLVLAKLAYDTFTGERWEINEIELQSALGSLPRVLQELGSPRQIRKALTGRFGVFTSAPDGRLEVLHQSFAELLCALWVAYHYDREPGTFQKWLRKHAGPRLIDPRWSEVWIHIASCVKDTTPLLIELWRMHKRAHGTPSNTRSDDVFSSALCLAGECIEAASGYVPIGWAARIQFRLLANSNPEHSRAILSRLEYAAIAIGRAGYLDGLLNAIEGPSRTLALRGASVLGSIGPAAAESLFRILRRGHKDRGVLSLIADGIGKLGSAARPILPFLIDQVSPDPVVGFWGMDGTGLLSAFSKLSKEVIPALVRQLDTGDEQKQSDAACLLGLLGKEAYDPDPLLAATVPVLIRVLEFGELSDDARECIESAIGNVVTPYMEYWDLDEIGTTEPDDSNADDEETSSVDLAVFVNGLSSKEVRVREVSARTLAVLSHIPTEVRSALPGLIRDPDPDVRYWSIILAGTLGPEAGAMIPDLRRNLRDHDHNVRVAAAWATGRLGFGARFATRSLVRLLRSDEVDRVRARCAESLGILGRRSRFVADALQEALNDEDRKVREAAAAALVQHDRLSPCAVRRLVDYYLDDYESGLELNQLVRYKGLITEYIIERVADGHDLSDFITGRLVYLLVIMDVDVAIAVAKRLIDTRADMGSEFGLYELADGLAGMGEAGVPRLVALLCDDDEVMRRVAARSLQLMGYGARAAIPTLVQEMLCEDGGVLFEAEAALQSIGCLAVPHILSKMQMCNYEHLKRIFERLRSITLPRWWDGETLHNMVMDSDINVRLLGYKRLRDLALAGVASVCPLIGYLRNPNPYVREAAAFMLEHLAWWTNEPNSYLVVDEHRFEEFKRDVNSIGDRIREHGDAFTGALLTEGNTATCTLSILSCITHLGTGFEAAADAISGFLGRESDVELRLHAIRALAKIGGLRASKALASIAHGTLAASDAPVELQLALVNALVALDICDESLTGVLVNLLRNSREAKNAREFHMAIEGFLWQIANRKRVVIYCDGKYAMLRRSGGALGCRASDGGGANRTT